VRVEARGLRDALARVDPVALALRLTLLDLLLRPIGERWVRPATLLLAGAGLVLPTLLRQPALWLALAACTAWRIASAWPLGDNHAYLLTYWCLAVSLALLAGAGDLRIARSARWLVGLAFAFAVLWKALSPDYLDGRFFRVTLVVDTRFETFTRVVGGFDAEALEDRRAFLTQHVDDAFAVWTDAPPEPPRFAAAARAATWGTIAGELAVALAFLWPAGRGPSRARDPLLLAFCAVTYAVAPVEGFAWLLLAMGLAQADRAQPWTRAAYPAVYALVLLYRELPWSRWLLPS
jgi:hypothetical protein